jgi:hypothetical protein
MSAYGAKRTFPPPSTMSAFGGKQTSRLYSTFLKLDTGACFSGRTGQTNPKRPRSVSVRQRLGDWVRKLGVAQGAEAKPRLASHVQADRRQGRDKRANVGLHHRPYTQDRRCEVWCAHGRAHGGGAGEVSAIRDCSDGIGLGNAQPTPTDDDG